MQISYFLPKNPYLCANTLPKMDCRQKHLICILLLAFFTFSCGRKDQYRVITGYAQGGTYSVKYNTRTTDGKIIGLSANAVKDSVDRILTCIDTTLSGYNKTSLLSRFNRGETIRPNRLFTETYKLGYGFYEDTDGYLDVASAPLFNLWGFGFTNDSLPDDSLVRKVMLDCGMKRLKQDMNSALDAEGNLSPKCLIKDECRLDTVVALPMLNYNAIAQGYSCDLVAAFLKRHGVKDMLVDIGEIYCCGVNPDGKSWRIGVDRPVDGNNSPGQDLDGIWESKGKSCGIVTSGNYRKFYVKDGKKYSHTIDPKTGRPVEHNLLSATIVAQDGITADAYATYCMVIGLEASQSFINNHSDEISGYLIYNDENGEMKEWASDGFSLAVPAK